MLFYILVLALSYPFDTMTQESLSRSTISITNTLDELTQERDRIKEDFEKLQDQAHQWHQGIIEQTSPRTTDFTTKITTNFIRKTDELDETISTIKDKNTTLKILDEYVRLAQKFVEYADECIQMAIDNLYIPMIKTILITQDDIRMQLGEKIGQAVSPRKTQKAAMLKEITIPVKVSREAPTVAKIATTHTGVQGLYEFITTAHPVPIEDKVDEKIALLTNIRSYQNKINDIFDIFNEAAQDLLHDIFKIQLTDSKALAPLKKSYVFLNDPDFLNAPSMVRFDNLRKFLADITAIIAQKNSTFSLLVDGFSGFIKITTTNDTNSKLNDLIDQLETLRKKMKKFFRDLDAAHSTTAALRSTITTRIFDILGREVTAPISGKTYYEGDSWKKIVWP